MNDVLEKYRTGNNEDEKQKEFRQLLKGVVYNKPDLIPERIKAKNFLNEGTNSEGGYLVPIELYDEIMKNIEPVSIVKRNAKMINSEFKEIQIPKVTTLPQFSFVDEGAEKPVSNPEFSQVILKRNDGGFIILLSKQLLEDSKFELMNFITEIATEIISHTIDEAGLKGKGTITGILDTTSGAQKIISGVSITGITYNHLINAISAIPSKELRKAKWYMHRSIWGHLKTLKYSEDGEYILSPEDKRDMILEGFPVELSDECWGLSDDAMDRGFIAFGDLKNMLFMVRDNFEISVSDVASVKVGETQINLWQRGLIGINFGVSFDIKFSYPENIAIICTSE